MMMTTMSLANSIGTTSISNNGNAINIKSQGLSYVNDRGNPAVPSTSTIEGPQVAISFNAD